MTRLDRERVNEVELVIKASDDCWSGQLEGLRGLQAWNYSDLSLMLLRVTVVDVNDNPPKFSKSHFAFGVTKDTQFGQSVWDLKVFVHCYLLLLMLPLIKGALLGVLPHSTTPPAVCCHIAQHHLLCAAT